MINQYQQRRRLEIVTLNRFGPAWVETHRVVDIWGRERKGNIKRLDNDPRWMASQQVVIIYQCQESNLCLRTLLTAQDNECEQRIPISLRMRSFSFRLCDQALLFVTCCWVFPGIPAVITTLRRKVSWCGCRCLRAHDRGKQSLLRRLPPGL